MITPISPFTIKNIRVSYFIISSIIYLGLLNPLLSQDVHPCGIPDNNFWSFEDILSCPDIGCNTTSTHFPELFPACLCGPSPGVACNYHTSHGTPHLTNDNGNHFGTMVAAESSTGLRRGEGIYFCSFLYEPSHCINLNFDLIVRRNLHYNSAKLYIKLVNPDEMIVQLGQEVASCILTPPNIDPDFLQTVQILDMSDYQAFNNTKTWFTHNLNIGFVPQSNVISTTTGVPGYYLWFYLDDSDQVGTEGDIVGIDDISLELGDLACVEYLTMYEPWEPFEGPYYAENAITLFSNVGDMFISETSTFQASDYIIIQPLSVATKISVDDYVLLEIVPIDCSECGFNEPPPYIGNWSINQNSYLENNAIHSFGSLISVDELSNNHLIDSNEMNQREQYTLVYDLFGHEVYNALQDNATGVYTNLKSLPSGLYILITKSKATGERISERGLFVP